MNALQDSLIELIRRTSAEIPDDVQKTILAALEREKKGTIAESAMQIIEQNIALAKQKSQPICQDTGSVLFYVDCPATFDQIEFGEKAREAVKLATKKGYLRQNSVDSLTGKNDGTNLGPGAPTLHFHQHRSPEVQVKLMLKGGGCENVGAQYSLPDESIKADRDLAGCRKVILDAVLQAQGKGCGPGVLGICIGGDRATGYEFSKTQLLRKLDDNNSNPELDKLEQEIVNTANELGIGPMGFGGKTTLLGAKICAANRVPASYFVSISYMCWAFRRQGITLDADGKITNWLYQDFTMAISLQTPLTEDAVRQLKVGDAVEITGVLFTGRDAVHKYFSKGGELPPGVSLQNGIIYHCGPVVIKDEAGKWKVVAAGPTTSIREEPYQADIIRKFGVRAVIGKGGMADRTLAACKDAGAVYLHAIGGAAQVLAERITSVRDVYFMEKFGSPEAIWELDVVKFPAVVTMDAHGHSLHQEVFAHSQATLAKLV